MWWTNWVVVAVAAVALAGCASNSTKTMEEVQKDAAKAAAVRVEAETKAAEVRQKQMEKHIAAVPKWSLQAPKPDASGIYAIGLAKSDDLALAIRKATLDAEFGLAKVYRQELSGSERSSVSDRNDRRMGAQYTAIVDKLVARVNVVGYEVVEQDIRPMDGLYHGFILVKLPYDSMNRVLQDQKSESLDANTKAAFDDLERRVRQRQQDRMEEEKERQDMRIKEMQARGDEMLKMSADSRPSAAAPVVQTMSAESAPKQ